jgi:predicted thioesterase
MAIEELQPGLSAEIITVVDDSLVVKHMGGEGVLSTPSMIGLMERAGIQAVQAILPEGYTTVGFEVHVKHFAPTPKGKKVTVRAELLEVDGRKLRFKVEAHDEDKKVGDGTHRRAVVQIQPGRYWMTLCLIISNRFYRPIHAASYQRRSAAWQRFSCPCTGITATMA